MLLTLSEIGTTATHTHTPSTLLLVPRVLVGPRQQRGTLWW